MKQFIAQAWGSNDPERFPGPQPISIERKHLSILKSEPYLVCEKNDGVRNMFVSGLSDRFGIFINRKFEMIQTTIPLPSGTVLDGELMEDVYLIYDAVMIRGKNVMDCPLTERLTLAKMVVPLATKGNVKVRVKPMLPLSRISEIQLGPKTDGLIFTPVFQPVRMGTHETCFKWKPRNHITIDFLVRNGHLCIQGAEEIKPLTRACSMGREPAEFEGQIVECEYGVAGWSIIKVRKDKDYPNNKRTYTRTLVNLRENIQLSEFIL
jgi:hypothetical protein